jgi:hypothetical protein
MRVLGALGLLVLSFSSPALARDRGSLGVLERQSLDDALAARGLAIDPAPEGKTIGQVHVVNQEVFSKRDGYFQLLNLFHWTTREHMISREALFRAGQPYRQEIIDETVRNLQDPELSSVVVIVPITASAPGTVDVLIVTRDVWSLRLNTNFEIQQGHVLKLQASLSENNLFGWRKQVALVFDMDQGRFALGPTYNDGNIAGTRLRLSASARALFRRADGDPEGSSSSISLVYPLFSLASKWGAGISFSHSDAITRFFLENDLRRVDLRGTPQMESLPWIYRQRTLSTGESVTRQLGTAFIHRVSAGHRFWVVRPTFTSDFPADPATRAAFAQQIFPRSERVSDLYLSWGMFTPRYYVYRDLDTFDLREDQRLGPNASASVSRAAKVLGSERNFSGVSVGGGWTFGYGGGLQSASAGWSARIEGGRVIDQTYSAGFYAASPVISRLVRVIVQGNAGALIDDTQNRFYGLGGDTGLRGYVVNDFVGKARAVGHVEVRSMPVAVASFRLGGVAFYDVGDAASPDPGTGADLVKAIRSVLRLQPKSDVGAGLRLLIPQLNAYVLRFDCAFPLNETPYTRAWYPRFSLGFQQAF